MFAGLINGFSSRIVLNQVRELNKMSLSVLDLLEWFTLTFCCIYSLKHQWYVLRRIGLNNTVDQRNYFTTSVIVLYELPPVAVSNIAGNYQSVL